MTDDRSTGGYEAMVRRRFAELDKGNFGILDELFDRTYTLNLSGLEEPLDLHATKRFYRALYAAFPDLRHEILEQISGGAKVVTRWIAHGTHEGMWMGIAPTGKSVRFGGINIYTIGHGLFTESHVTWDMLSVFKQIGAVSVKFEAPHKGAGAS